MYYYKEAVMAKRYKIGDIIDHRPDGSFIYMSHNGILNLDDKKDLEEAREEDNAYLADDPRA